MDVDSHVIIACADDGATYIAETDVGLTLRQAAEMIASGEVARPQFVWSFNPVEGWCRDVSEDVAREVAHIRRNDIDHPDYLLDFVETSAGRNIAAILRANMED